MATLELCREPMKFSGRICLGVHSNVAGDREEYTAGHAWVTVETVDKVFFFGLWPDGHPRVADRRGECSDVRLDMERGVRPRVSRYYELTVAQVERLNRFLNHPDSWAYTNTCAAWVARLVREVIGTRLSAIDYAVFSTPRELGRELLLLEAKSPTSPRRPRIGEFPEVGAGASSW